MAVAIVTDSTSYLPAELIERHGVHVVPLYVVFDGDRPVPEVEITDYDEFFEELRGAERLPTTSQPSVGDFTSAYEPLLADGREVVSIHISGGAVRHARGGAPGEEALERDGKGGERITVVDSQTTAGGLGLHGAGRGARPSRDGAEPRGSAAHVAEARGRVQDLVRDRHARVPQARRADRRRQRLDRLDAEGEADPHRGVRDDPGRAGADQLARVRADGRLRAPAQGLRAPKRGRRSTSTRRSSVPRWSSAARDLRPRARPS